MPDGSVASSVFAVIVHHRSLGTIGATLGDVVAAGIPPSQLVVVDNSEDEVTLRELNRLVAGRAHLLVTENRGYGAAVNRAVAQHGQDGARYVLVLTHEVRIDRLSMEALLAALLASSDRAVAAPQLFVTGTSRIWSAGGTFTHWLRLPVHETAPRSGTGWVPVPWVDGACCLYRADVLRENPIREDFFMYYEETDLHLRLRQLGWDVGVTPEAIAYQSPGSMTSYQRVRGLVLLQASRESPATRLAAATFTAAVAVLLSLLGGRPTGVSDAAKGLLVGMRDARRHRRLERNRPVPRC